MSISSPKNVALPDNFSIPTLPTVVHRVTSLLEDPNVGVREIAAIVAEDAPLAAKVLKIANSAYYGLRERCLSTQQAAAVLGLRVLRNVVTQASVIQQYEHLGGMGFDIDALWRHSIVTAQSCHFLSRRCRRKIDLSPDELYVCGLLHDLGQVVLLDNQKANYVEVVKHARGENVPLHVAEQQAFGFDHTDVGHKIATRWGLPPAVIGAIHLHHGPEASVDRDPVTALIARTDALVDRVAEQNLVAASSAFTGPSAALLGLTSADVHAVVTFVAESYSAVEV